MEVKSKKSNTSFFREAMIISISNFAVKIMGVFLKVSLADVLGSAMGAFTSAYAIYAMLYMISTAGLPVAISKMIAEASEKGRKNESKRIFFLTMAIFGAIGIVASSFMFLGSKSIGAWTEHENAVLAMKVISPTLFLICVSSAIRGYFQGLRYMVPTAVSQFIEAFIKVALGLGGAFYASYKGYSGEVQAAFATVGLTAGVLLGTLYLIVFKAFSKKHVINQLDDECDSFGTLGKRIAVIALPVTITSSALYLSSFMDTLVINKRLIASGYGKEMADSLFSAYTSLSTSISELLPSTFVYPIAISILPFVSGALVAKKYDEAKKNMMNSIRISGLIALPCAAALCALARPCIGVIFGTNYSYSITLLDGTVKSPLDVAAPALSVLSIGIFFISMVSTTNALLQACGKTMLPVVSVLSGVCLLTVCEIFLVGNPEIGILGAPISSVVCYSVSFALNFAFLKKHQGLELNIIKLFGKNIICAAFCGIGAWGVYRGIFHFLSGESRQNYLLCLIPAGVVAVVIYFVLTLALKATTREEIELLPFGRKISAFLQKKKIL